jgi:hypothetical protein
VRAPHASTVEARVPVTPRRHEAIAAEHVELQRRVLHEITQRGRLRVDSSHPSVGRMLSPASRAGRERRGGEVRLRWAGARGDGRGRLEQVSIGAPPFALGVEKVELVAVGISCYTAATLALIAGESSCIETCRS